LTIRVNIDNDFHTSLVPNYIFVLTEEHSDVIISFGIIPKPFENSYQSPRKRLHVRQVDAIRPDPTDSPGEGDRGSIREQGGGRAQKGRGRGERVVWGLGVKTR